MADTKISALTAATTPLAGTEVLPIVQSGNTVKVTNNDLRPKQIQSNATSGVLQIVGPAAAATRVMTVPDANFTAARTDAAQTFTGTQTFGVSKHSNVGVGNPSGNPYFLNFAKVATNVGGSAAAVFTVVCAATNSAWTPGFAVIRVAGEDQTQSGRASAWWQYLVDVIGGVGQGNASVDSGGNTGSFSVAIADVSSTASTVTFTITVTATNLDYVCAYLELSQFSGVISIS